MFIDFLFNFFFFSHDTMYFPRKISSQNSISCPTFTNVVNYIGKILMLAFFLRLSKYLLNTGSDDTMFTQLVQHDNVIGRYL